MNILIAVSSIYTYIYIENCLLSRRVAAHAPNLYIHVHVWIGNWSYLLKLLAYKLHHWHDFFLVNPHFIIYKGAQPLFGKTNSNIMFLTDPHATQSYALCILSFIAQNSKLLALLFVVLFTHSYTTRTCMWLIFKGWKHFALVISSHEAPSYWLYRSPCTNS
jgi:hypothetical protein